MVAFETACPLFPLQTAGVPKSLRPSSRGTIAPQSISALSADRPRTASVILDPLRSAPRRLQSFRARPACGRGSDSRHARRSGRMSRHMGISWVLASLDELTTKSPNSEVAALALELIGNRL